MNALGRLLAWIVAASTMVGAAAVILMMLQIVADVLLKNLVNAPIPATSLIVSHYYMVIVAYLPVALSEKLNSHISVEIVFRHFSERWQKFVIGIVWLVSALVAGGIAHRLWFEALKKLAVEANVLESGLKIFIWPSYFVLPLGFGLFALVLLYRFACSVTGLASGLGETPVDAESKQLPASHEPT
ncbi:MAG: TRAP transporter small permease [Hoeflea sp.]